MAAEYVDFDTHVYEPFTVYSDYVDPKFRDRVPRPVEGDDGRLLVQIGTQMFPTAPRHPGFRKIYGEDSKMDRSGNDPKQRLGYMDKDGADVHVIFPTLGMTLPGGVRDGELAAALARAYNRYIGEFASLDRRRLRPTMIIPANHPDRAAEEMRWAHEHARLGLAVLTPTAPDDVPWSHPSRDPIWRTAQELGVTLVFHETTATCAPNAVGISRYAGNWPMTYLCTHVVEVALAFADILLGGTLERFPRLKVGAAEAHVHWLPGWLSLMDQSFGAATRIWSDASGEFSLKLKPSEYFRRQCFLAAFPGDTMLAEAVRAAPEGIVICSDWPHPIAAEHSSEGLRGVAKNPELSAQVRRSVLVDNAQRFL